MKRLTLIFASLFLCIGMALAQVTASGVVVSADDGEPVIGCAVAVKGNNTVGTVTDAEGHFTLKVANGAQLTFSYVGMTTQTLKAAQNMRVELQGDNTGLDEVVVLGYGTGRKIGSLTGTVSVVNSDKVKNAPSANALDALQGQVAGLNVLSSSGVAGDNAVSISLHGIGSLGASSTPLYVIDGIPSSSRTIMAMNPNDIKSVSVLKDASATSIYGSRAANGVIYVTTKNGSYNSQAKVTFRSQVGWNKLANRSLYENMMDANELYDFYKNNDLCEELTGVSADEYISSKFDWDETTGRPMHNTKWYEVFQNISTLQTQNDLSIEGGGERASYMIGASQFHQDGMAIGNYYDRYTFRTNLNAKPLTWLRTGVNVNLSYDKNQQNNNWGNSSSMSNNTNGGLSYILNPWQPAYQENGELYPEQFPSGHTNPHYVMSMTPNYYSRYGLQGNAYVQITPMKGLTITSRTGSDMYFRNRSYKRYPTYIGAAGKGARAMSSAFEYTYTITNTAEYKFNIDRVHNFTVLAGQEGTKNNYTYFSASSSNQILDSMLELGQGTQSTYSVDEGNTASRFLSYFGRFDYNFSDKYFFDVTLRNDASSRFGAENRNATFWAIGGMWKVSSEQFMKNIKWVNSLSLKASYGTQGNSGIGDYTALGLMSTSTDYNSTPSITYQQPYNGKLTWEKQGLFTVGLSGRVLNRIDFELEYYNRKTSNMLMDVPYPYTAGFTDLTSNVGSLVNQGVDIKLGVDIAQGKDWYVKFNTTFNYNAQKITELFDGRDRWEIANTMVAYKVGSPVMFYLPLYAGVNPENGHQQWYVAGDDVDVTTKGEVTENFDEAALTQNSGKRRYAPVNGGFGVSAGWKGLSFQADFSYVLGKYLVNNDAFFYRNPLVVWGYTSDKAVMDYWTEDNTNAKYPDWRQGEQMEFDSHLLENASFLRLKNLQVAYDLPKKLIGFQNVVRGIKLSFTGRNLLTVTNYSGIDPEVNSNITYGKTGNTKQYLFGLEVTF